MTVDIFIPCFIDQLYPQTAWNMVKVLEKVGCKVNYNPEQTCCGQPAFNAGFWEEATNVCQKFIADFDSDRYVVCPSGSCVGYVRNHAEKLLKEQLKNKKQPKQPKADRHLPLNKRIYELSEFLVYVLSVENIGAKFKGVAAYHDACGALRECGIKTAPRQLLEQVEGLELQETPDCEVCCGFGGTFAVKYEPISIAMAEQKVNHILKHTEANYLISTDLSCLMHLDTYIQKQGKSKQLKVMHLADVLASF